MLDKGKEGGGPNAEREFRLPGKIRGAVAVFIVVICGGSCLFLYFSFVSFPSTNAIARHYLEAVVREDLNGSMAWVDEACRQEALEHAQNDIDQFGNSEIREVAVEVVDGGGSDDELQFARVSFEYRKTNEDAWQEGGMQIGTDHAVPGFRYHCGNMFSGR